MRKRDDVARGSGRGGWAPLALFCAFLGCLNPRPEELPSHDAPEIPAAAMAAPGTLDEPAAANAATGPAEQAPTSAPEAAEDAAPEADQARRGAPPPPPADAGADAAADAGAD